MCTRSYLGKLDDVADAVQIRALYFFQDELAVEVIGLEQAPLEQDSVQGLPG
jgi:hypothetical protein